MRTIPGVLLAVGVMSGSGQVALAQTPPPELAVALPPIEVSIDCYSSPETVIVTNNRADPITVKSIGSTHLRRSGEPHRVRKVLKPGRRVVYTFGAGKGGRRLSGSFIFDNEAASEAVVVKTSKGRVKVKCTEGTNAPPPPDAPVPSETVVEVVPGQSVDALALLATLWVEPEIEDGYDRDLFRHWVDVDGDGCDTREEVLMAESLTPVTTGAGCSIEGGTWFSPFDGDTLTNPASLDINHTVPLKEAWRSGAAGWTSTRREAFANDLGDDRTLRAVSSGANRQQGENDPATWLPADRNVACEFVADWVMIKATWGLSVDEVEREAIETTLRSCPTRAAVFTPQESDGAPDGEP